MMADDDDNYKDRFKYIIVAIVVLVVGAVTVSIVSGAFDRVDLICKRS